MWARAPLVVASCATTACSLLLTTDDLVEPTTPSALDAAVDADADDPRDAALDASAFPATPVLDSFDRADGPLGSSWISDAHFNVVANAARYTEFCPNGSGGCGPGTAIWSTELGPTQEIHVRLASLPGYGYIDLLLKSDTGRHVSVHYDVGMKTIEISSAGPGGGSHHTQPFVLARGDQLGARHYPDGRTVVFRNGAVLVETRTAGWAFNDAGGRVAFYAACAGNGAGTTFDDFGGGNVPP
jgi:hypothetical protein